MDRNTRIIVKRLIVVSLGFQRNYRKFIFESTKEEITDKNIGEDIVVSYVLNINSKRFYYLDCKSASDMKEKNKKNVDWTRDECITNGYKPCGNCRP